jgi:hypothetical protein
MTTESPELDQYLSQSYRRDVLGESVKVETPVAEPRLIDTVKAELARIEGLRMGANLVNRNFVLAQHKRALERLLKELEANRAPDVEGP